jgi:Fe-S-cluster containining protein
MKRSKAPTAPRRTTQAGPTRTARVPDGGAAEQVDLAAGDFSAWMSEMKDALGGKRASDVPCGGCTACCTSSQFIHIGPDETATLARIPRELLFPAPGLPRGHVLLGYDERGHCPMLVDGQCSIYEHRPRTCRTYDCRIFPATGLALDDGESLIARQARRWRFGFPSAADRTQYEAARAASAFLRERAGEMPAGLLPANPTQLAVLAVEIHAVFLGRDEVTGEAIVIEPELDVVRAEVKRRTRARGGT